MELASDEKTVIDATFGLGPLGGTVTLTNRRIVVVSAHSEESIPLGALTSIRTGFVRNVGGAFWGGVLLAAAIAFGAAYRPLETAVNSLGMAIEKRMNEKALEGEVYGRYLYVPGGAVWLLMLPLIGFGLYKVADGLLGETVLAISTAGGVVLRSGRGRREDLLDFGAEVGRRAGR